MKPLIDRVQNLIRKVVARVVMKDDDGRTTKTTMDEVVLVGGATRVPAVQTMLRKEFPSIPDLCSSLSAEGAVAQGAAIQAAIKSGLVPLSELKSAMMLDALPHAIGVLLPDGKTYVPILEKDAQLPAMGYATFTLADIHQSGVTVVAVEDVGVNSPLERIGEFNFLLRRLAKDQVLQMKGATRTVDIGMTMATSGELTVSIFDENDPEHLRKKQKFQRHKNGGGEIGYDEKEIEDDGVPVLLIVGCVVLFFVYIGVKLAFHDPE
eukprot:CAMPEP_0119022808 /NCGR_PEP_ID=MMETSP1176-20130426/28779_1 /TAXON_ID=265551 /ORGANISM="Synedropsis recta cf, Strain CCMP1620" /LENGTH=264 /DNA_ID=CAMNT_0006977747 /DNA_START=33 /DNA_END=824 /DNA_ORIENTATION=-